MIDDIFNCFPTDDFFVPWGSPNKKIYGNVLMKMFRRTKRGTVTAIISRVDALDDVNYILSEYSDDKTDYTSNDSSNDKASDVLNQLCKVRWIERKVNFFEDNYVFHTASIQILTGFLNMSRRGATAGFGLYTDSLIHSLHDVIDINTPKPYQQAFKRAVRYAFDFIAEFQTILKSFQEKWANINSFSDDELIEAIESFIVDVTSGLMYELEHSEKINADNKKEINEMLEQIQYNNEILNRILEDASFVLNGDKREIKIEILKDIRDIRNFFEQYEKLYNELTKTIQKFLKNARMRLDIIIANSDNISERILSVVDFIQKHYDDKNFGSEVQEKTEKYFNIPNVSAYNESNVLYKPSKIKIKKEEDVPITNFTIDRDSDVKNLCKYVNNSFSIDNINNDILNRLKDKEEIEFSEFACNTKDDALYLIFIFLNESQENAKYKLVEQENKFIQNKDFKINNYKIRRK